ncbi:MAG TPA: polysaccharide deacetylase family protein [Candidatus Sulfotelmatobacter sp.]|nr:polysaccharide deacetylase family protein [Candidatus Sulfotelmatobacter sp.]
MARPIVFLMYHELELPGRSLIQSAPGYVRYILPQITFRSQIEWLQQNGWKGLSVSEALEYPDFRAVAVTFDDGCETDLIAAAPILRDAGFHATSYVTAGFVDKPGYLSRAQLLELSSLFEIGCHSMTHPYLNDLSDEQQRVEVADARAKLEDIIGRPVEHFSCPGGRYDERTLAVAKNAGYRSLATSETKRNDSSTDLYHLGRVAVMRTTTAPAFAGICSGSGLWKIRMAELARDTARKVMGNTLYDRARGRVLR